MELDEVFVVKTAKHRGYIEQFSHTSINFTQKHLGTICGFFIVRNKDKYNAHIVNFLTSEIKKEFFAVSKRNISEAFEAALLRGNRALTELAKNDNVAWIGSIDGAVCAYDNNNVYFSVTGKGSVFLIRDNNIINLSEGLASDESATTPMKTFVDTSHGALYNLDRLIITSNELTDFISLNELKNNSLRFDNKEFKQLILTILKNESEIASTTIVSVTQKIIHEPIHTAISEQEYEVEDESEQQVNVFGADAFTLESPNTPKEETKEVITPKKGDYTDKRTGHIYVQGDKTQSDRQSQFSAIVNKTKDVVSDLSYEAQTHSSKIHHKLLKSSRTTLDVVKDIVTSEKVKQILPSTKNYLKEKSKQVYEIAKKKNKMKQKGKVMEISNATTNIKELKIANYIPNKLKKPESQTKTDTNKVIEGRSDLTINSTKKKKKIAIETISTNLTISNSVNKAKKILLPTISKTLKLSKITVKKSTTLAKKTASKVTHIIKDKLKRKPITSNKESKSTTNKTKTLNLSNNSSIIKDFFKGISKTTTIATASFVFILIAVPLIFNKIYSNKAVTITTENVKESKDSNHKNNIIEETDKRKIKQKTEKEVAITTFSKDMKFTDINNTKLITPLPIGETLITTMNSFVKIDKDTKKTIIKIPKEYGNIIHATYMTDLMHIFFITDKNALYSYSPKVDTFEKQSITKNLDHKKIKALGSYLTYIYILENDTITRHARTEGGFNAATEWYKGTSFSGRAFVSIDGDIYVTENDILSVFSNKKLTKKTVPGTTKAKNVYTNENLKLVWVLDTENKVITGHNKKTLSIEKTITNEGLSDATNFIVNEKTKIITVSTNSEIYKLPF